MTKHKQWWGEYDTNGQWEIVFDYEDYTPTVCRIGPFPSFSKAKREVYLALRHCKMEITGAMQDVKACKKPVI